eukprot:2810006-Rhodomonas_salina.1
MSQLTEREENREQRPHLVLPLGLEFAKRSPGAKLWERGRAARSAGGTGHFLIRLHSSGIIVSW